MRVVFAINSSPEPPCALTVMVRVALLVMRVMTAPHNKSAPASPAKMIATVWAEGSCVRVVHASHYVACPCVQIATRPPAPKETDVTTAPPRSLECVVVSSLVKMIVIVSSLDLVSAQIIPVNLSKG